MHRTDQISFVRERAVLRDAFPLVLKERERGRCYLDSAATTQKPSSVIRAVTEFYENRNANVHRGLHRLSVSATEAFESARRAVGRFINAEDPSREVIFCRGATEAINLAAHGYGNKHLSPGDEIVLSTMEHHSNIIPWQFLCARTGARIVEVRPDEGGRITPEALKRTVTNRTRIIGLTHVSNLLGTVNDVKAFAEIAKEAGAVFLVDGAQALGHLPVDVRDIGCDLYAGSGHKMFGPSGTGFLYGRRVILESFQPFLGGGEMIEEVSLTSATFAPLPARLEAGTPNIAGAAGLAEAIAFLEKIGMPRVRAHDQGLMRSAFDRLGDLPWLEVYGPGDPALRSGLVSFNIRGLHAHDLGSFLDEFGIAVRAGHLCAQPLLRHLGRSSCVRASFALYNDTDDVMRLAEGLERAAAFFGVDRR